jgi:hypothetical protein
MKIIAIDPGAAGGIAWSLDGIAECCPMPDGMTEQLDKLRELCAQMPGARVVIERVGTYMPGNSGPAAATFARHCGHIEAGAYMLAMPTTQVTPATWQKALGTWPKDKKERKHAIREEMQRRYPYLRVTLKTADALGILTWAMAQGEGAR